MKVSKTRKSSKKDAKKIPPPAVYDTMEAAAAGLRQSLATVSTSKDMGCPAFRGGRIYEADYWPWFEAHKTEVLSAAAKLESKDEADARVARARANRMEFELEVRRRQFIPTHEVSQVFTRACVAIKSKMLAIPSSLAPRLAIMNSPDDIATILKTAVVDALTELSKTKWNKSK